MIRILSIVAAALCLLAVPSPAEATGVVASVVQRVRVQRVVVAPVVQRVVVQRQVVVQQVVAQKFVAAAIVQPVVAVQAISALNVGYGYSQQFVQPVYAPAAIQAYSAPSQQLLIEQERTRQEQLRTEQIRLQLTAPK